MVDAPHIQRMALNDFHVFVAAGKLLASGRYVLTITYIARYVWLVIQL